MADYDGEHEQDQAHVTDDDQVDQHEGETPEGNDQNEGDAEGDGPAGDEVVITIGEEAPPHDEAEKEAAPAWVKELRKADREKAKRIRELEQQVAARQEAEKPVAMPKPTLADCDFDEDVFEQKLTAWHDQQRAVKAKQEAQEAEAKKAQDAWNTRLSAYNEAKAKLSVSNFDEIEEEVKGVMSPTQLSILISGADKPEQLVYAIGSNPARLKELASMTDLARFTFAVAKLETQLKVTPRKAPPAPERVIRGSAAAVGVNDPKLARLEAAADKTGDRSELIAYKRAMKAKAA